MKRLVIVGAGGLGREILVLVRDVNRAFPNTWDFRGFLARDEPNAEILKRMEAPYLGSDQDMGVLDQLAGTHFVAALGSSSARRVVYEATADSGLVPASLVHPSALVGADVQLGEGTIVAAASILTTNIRLGRGTVIDRSVNVGHDCRIGDFVTLAPGSTLSGSVRVGDQCYVGTNACTVQGVTIGAYATVGAGAVVNRDVAEGTTVAGVPARPITR